MQMLPALAVSVWWLHRRGQLAPGPRARELFFEGAAWAWGGGIRAAAVVFVAQQLIPAEVLADVDVAGTAASAASGSVGLTIALLLIVALLGPVYEELWFRGVLLGGWLEDMDPRWAIALSSVAFAFIHDQYGGSLLITLWIGLTLGWARWKSEGLLLPVALHCGWNAAMALLAMSRVG
jgi:hypothetical protein